MRLRRPGTEVVLDMPQRFARISPAMALGCVMPTAPLNRGCCGLEGLLKECTIRQQAPGRLRVAQRVEESLPVIVHPTLRSRTQCSHRDGELHAELTAFPVGEVEMLSVIDDGLQFLGFGLTLVMKDALYICAC